MVGARRLDTISGSRGGRNQMTETHRVRELAEVVSRLTGAEVQMISNPRNESDENDLFVANDQFLGHGLNPITLAEWS